MTKLQRITTKYSDEEDRLYLIGENETNEVLTLHLTQRLLTRLLSHLFELITKKSSESAQNPSKDLQATDLLQGFAQQAAQAELPQQPPVETSSNAKSWLVKEVDIATSTDLSLTLTFKSSNGDQASLQFRAQQLRQWLTIVNTQWIKAEWPLNLWPNWMRENNEKNPEVSDSINEGGDGENSNKGFH